MLSAIEQMSIYQIDFALDVGGIALESFDATLYTDAIAAATGFDHDAIMVTSVSRISLRARRRVVAQERIEGLRIFTTVVVDRVEYPDPGGLSERIVVTTQSGTMTQAMIAGGMPTVSTVGVSGIAATSAGIAIADSPILPMASYNANGDAVPRSEFYTPLEVVPPTVAAEKDWIDWLPWIIGIGAGSVILAILSLVCLARPRGRAFAANVGPILTNDKSSCVVKPKQRKPRSGPSRKVSVWRGTKNSVSPEQQMTRVRVMSRDQL